jgi:hypothetical protein
MNRNNSKFIALVNNSVDQEFSLPEIGESDDDGDETTL